MKSHDVTVETIGTLIKKQLGSKVPKDIMFSTQTNFEELGMSSLDFTEVFFAIEERLAFELDPAAAADVKTIGDLIATVDKLVADHHAKSGTPSPPEQQPEQ